MSLRSLRLQRRYRSQLAGLEIPDPWDIEVFCARLAEQRGRPLHLLPMPPQKGTEKLCGLWVPCSDADYVFTKWNTSRWAWEYTVLHECGHMVLRHPPSKQVLVAGWVQEFIPQDHWDHDKVTAILARSRFDSPQEIEAETFAELIESRANRPPAAVTRAGASTAIPAEHADLVDRWTRALGAATASAR